MHLHSSSLNISTLLTDDVYGFLTCRPGTFGSEIARVLGGGVVPGKTSLLTPLVALVQRKLGVGSVRDHICIMSQP
jgi:hypothetical protein